MSELNQASSVSSGSSRVSTVVRERGTHPESTAMHAIFAAGLTCGGLDITAAFVNCCLRGLGPKQLLQGIASGLLGPESFRGGWWTAGLGLVIHFFIAFSAATFFYVASRKLKWLTERAVLSGIAYGVCVYVVMYWVVIPLSRIAPGPFSLWQTILAMVVHVVCVGLPISLSIRRFSAQA